MNPEAIAKSLISHGFRQQIPCTVCSIREYQSNVVETYGLA